MGLVRNILLVDDDSVGRGVLAMVLRRTAAAGVLEADSAQDALRVLAKVPSLELFVLDAMMPGMSGYDLCRQLRADARWAAVPIVLLSAHVGQEAAQAGKEAGATEVLYKPFDPLTIGDVLLDIVRACVVELSPRQGRGSRLRADAVTQAIAELQPQFHEGLKRVADSLAAALVRSRRGEVRAVEEVRLLTHRLAGTAGSYGQHAISRQAAVIEQALESQGALASGLELLGVLIDDLRKVAN